MSKAMGWLEAITVETTVEIEHWELGRLFAEWSNEEQARFLYGATVGFADLGGWGHMQLKYIVDAAKADGTQPEVLLFLELLREYFKDES
jgi:hypothetical protein